MVGFFFGGWARPITQHLGLARYDSARAALAAARRVDEAVNPIGEDCHLATFPAHYFPLVPQRFHSKAAKTANPSRAIRTEVLGA